MRNYFRNKLVRSETCWKITGKKSQQVCGNILKLWNYETPKFKRLFSATVKDLIEVQNIEEHNNWIKCNKMYRRKEQHLRMTRV